MLGFAPLRARAAGAVVVAASLLPLTGLALGVVLRDGFLPILLLVPLILCSLTVLGWLNTTDRTGAAVTVAVGVSAAAIPLLAFTWTPHAVVVGVAALLPWLRALRAGDHRAPRLLMMGAGTATAAAYCLFVLSQAHGFVDIPGAIASPTPVTALLVPVLVLLIATGRWSAIEAGAFVPYLVGTVAAAGITAYAVLVQAEGLPWNYFPAKIAWTWLLAGLPLLLVPVRAPTGRPRAAGHGGRRVHRCRPRRPRPVSADLTGPAEPGRLDAERPGPDPDDRRLGPARRRLAAAGRRAGPSADRYVVYGVSPEDDRLTNFWLAAYDPYDGPTNEDEFITWGYHETGTAADVCALLDLQPDRVVATADPAAEQQLRQECGRDVRVRLLRTEPRGRSPQVGDPTAAEQPRGSRRHGCSTSEGRHAEDTCRLPGRTAARLVPGRLRRR